MDPHTDTFMENGILVEYKYLEQEEIESKLKNTWIPNNITEFFFFDEFGFLSISEKKVSECYNALIMTMKLIYDNIKTQYKEFLKDLHLDDESELEFPTMIHELDFKPLNNFLKE